MGGGKEIWNNMSDGLKIGWMGLGNMGNPMAKNLINAGFEVLVYNRTKAKENDLKEAGAQVADSPGQLMESCDVVVTMLSDDQAVLEVYEEMLAPGMQPPQARLMIDMSTVAPETSRYLSGSCGKNGLDFLEAPVSGSVMPAREGALIILVGGTAENYNIAKPIFEVLGKMSIHLGGAGVGSSAKLAINYLLGLNLQGLAETMIFAQNNGVDPGDMLTIVNEGACGNGITKLKTPSILNKSYPAAFALKHLTKDLRLAKMAGLKTPLMQPLFESFDHAYKLGLGEEDVMAIIKSLNDE